MPTYEHKCNNCEHKWDDFYSIVADPPTLCPSCNVDWQVKRLIYGGSGKGVVVLGHHELIAKCKSDGQQLKRDAASNENLLANLVGEDRYHSNELLKNK